MAEEDDSSTGSHVADRRQARHDQEWELFSLLEHVPVGIVVVTAAGKPYYANSQARRLLGMGDVPDHVSKFSEVYQAFVIGTDALYPTQQLPLVRALLGERCEVSDLEIRRDGRPAVPLHVSGAPVKIGGELAFAVAALQDVRELRRIATRDALTGLPNRTAAIETYARERLLADRSRQPLALALVDFDHFKRINDTHGHAAGDDVLCQGAAAISGVLRATDLVARWGGEELLVVMPNTDLAGGAAAIETALAAVRALEFAGGLRVTFSAGVVEAVIGESIAAVVARADAALYAAKHAGRDQIVTA
jgi:diguanylate cyclase (GGDEF)-like protein